MSGERHSSRVRAGAALALMLALGLLAAASAFARPFHPAAEKPATRSEAASPVDPRC